MKKPEKVKSVESVITQSNTILLTIAVLLFGCISLVFIFFSSMQVMAKSLTNTANGTAQRIEGLIESYKNLCGSFSTVPSLSLPDEVFSREKKLKMLEDRADQFGLLRVGILNKDGSSDLDGFSRSKREYFQEALKGNITINDPVVTMSDNKTAIIVGGPIWKNGIRNSEVNSVVFCSIYPETFNDIMKDMGPSKNARGRIIGRNGIAITSLDENIILGHYSNISAAQTNPKLKNIAKIEEAALSTKNTFFIFQRGLTINASVSAQINGTQNWVLMLEAPISDYLINFYLAFIIFIIAGIIVVETCRSLMKKYAKQISVPVTNMAERLRKAAVGDFTSEVESEDTLTEVRTISNATQKLVNRMAMVLNDTNESSVSQSTFNFFKMIDFQDFNNTLGECLKVSICIVDSKGELLVGSIPKDLLGSVEEKIYAGNKIFGKCYIVPKENCNLSNPQLKKIIRTLTDLISKLFELLINREGSFQAYHKNELINMNDILTGTENISKQIKEMISSSQNDLSGGLKRDFNMLASRIDESTEFIRFTDMNSQIQEKDYILTDLISRIITKNIILIEPYSKKLFGDVDNIERSINRILQQLVAENENSDIGIVISCNKQSMGTNLKIRISDKSPAFTENQIERLKLLANKMNLNGDILTTAEQKFLSAFKQIKKMNGSVSVECFGSGILNISISIPQLEAE